MPAGPARRVAVALTSALLAATLIAAGGDRVTWRHLSSASGDLPVPGSSTQQTGAIVADLDHDGVNDFVLSFRQTAPALVGYRRTPRGWDRLVIEPDFLTVEAGGAAFDIDGDGDLDLVFGGDWQSTDLWWWENPGTGYVTGQRWIRRLIKTEGATQHHDQIFGDFLGTGRPQLVFWNQNAKAIWLAEVPANPRATSPWPATKIFEGAAGEPGGLYPEGLAAADVDGDGQVDLLAGNAWFTRKGGSFRPIRVAPLGGRIAAGQLVEGGPPEIVIAPGDGTGPLRWYSCQGDPADPTCWQGRGLVDGDMIHGHSLALGDVDGDGHLDVFAAEMAQWKEGAPAPDNPDARAWIFYGDGRGGFTTVAFAHGMDFHEARLADLDGDGRLDVLEKPYTWNAPRVDVWLNRRP
jgi:FG-GAP-like repeat